MLTAVLFTSVAGFTAIDVNWSPTINTFLLLVLAVVTIYKERAAKKDRAELAEKTDVVIEKADQTVKTAKNIEQKITGEHRPPDIRTRADD